MVDKKLMFFLKKRNTSIKHAAIALDNKLFIDSSDWHLMKKLKETISGEVHNYVRVFYKNKKPISVIHLSNNCIQVFVKKEYRNKGQGSKMIEFLKKELKKHNLENFTPKANLGIPESFYFWKKNNIKLY